MAKLLLLGAWLGGGWLAQQAPAPDISPLAYWGVAGVLLTFILWLYLDERREKKALIEKLLSDYLPALLSNNEQMRETSEQMRDVASAAERLTVMAHDISSRPNIDPVAFNEWSRTMRDVQRLLERIAK